MFPDGVFRLLPRPPPTKFGTGCGACGDLLHSDGFVYHCAELGGMDLHPRCARLPPPSRDVVVGASRRNNFQLVPGSSCRHRRCGICMSGDGGYRHRFWSYRCWYNKDEAVDIHMSCLKELASQSHEKLTKLYEILMGACNGIPWMWMPTENRGECSAKQVKGTRYV
jgi:hypothetical protein